MWPNLQEAEDLVTYTEEIFNEKLHVLRSTKKAWNNWSEKFLHNTLIVAEIVMR